MIRIIPPVLWFGNITTPPILVTNTIFLKTNEPNLLQIGTVLMEQEDKKINFLG